MQPLFLKLEEKKKSNMTCYSLHHEIEIHLV